VILTAKNDVTCKFLPYMTGKILDGNKNASQSCVISAESGIDLVLRAFVTMSRENLAKTAEIKLALRQHYKESDHERQPERLPRSEPEAL